jgi:capsular polysaccharide transport system permease protein
MTASMTDIPPLPTSRPRRHKTARSVSALVLREMATTYGRSPGGYLWAVIEPAAAIALLTVVFSLALRSPSLGESFALFYATGYLPFTFYNSLQSKISVSIRFSKALLAYPAVTFVDAILARFVLNTLTLIMVTFVVIGGIVLMEDLRLRIDLPAALLAFGLAALLGLGIGTLNCFVMSMVPVWQTVWAILTRPLFLISGILFTFEEMPQAVREIAWWNPLFHVTGLARRAFYPTYDAAYASVWYAGGIGVLTLFFGLLLLGRWHREILTAR